MKTRINLHNFAKHVFAIGLMCFSATYAQATDINWKGTPYTDLISTSLETFDADSKAFYLYNVGQKKFITTGRSFDAEPILTNVGMKMIIAEAENGTGKMFIRTSLNNKSSLYAFGLKGNTQDADTPDRLLCDLKPQITPSSSNNYLHDYQCGWYLTPVSEGSNRVYISNCRKGNDVNIDRLYYNQETGYLDVGDNVSGENAEWLLITLADYEQEIMSLREGEIEVTAYVADSRFGRNNLWVSAWKWDNNDKDGILHKIGEPEYPVFDDGHVGTKEGFPGGWAEADPERNNINVNYYSQFNAAEVKSGQTNRLYQTISGLPAGSYRITCQAFYDDGISGRDTDSGCYLFANEQQKTLCPITDIISEGSPYYEPHEFSYTDDDNTHTFTQTYCTTSDSYGKTVPTDGVAAAMFFNYDASSCCNEVYVNLREGEDLVIGFNKGKETGWVAADNFRLYYLGRYEYVLDEDLPPTQVVDDDLFDANVNLRRTFGQKWTSLVLPFDLTTAQFENAFGEGAVLSELVGIDPDRSTRILFKVVEKGGSTDVFLKQGVHYIINGAKEPAIASGSEYSFVINNNEQLTTTVEGPAYQFSNISRQSNLPQPMLLNIQMHSSGNAFDRSNVHHEVTTVAGRGLTVKRNDIYGRYEATFASTSWGGTKGDGYYSVSYASNQSFRESMQSGHALAVWVKLNYEGSIPTGEAELLSSKDETGGFSLLVKDGTLQYCVYTDGSFHYVNSGVAPENGKYYYVVGTWDKENAQIFVDGVQKATAAASGTLMFPATGNQLIGLGGMPTQSGLAKSAPCSVLLARIYEKALSADEVRQLFARLQPIKDVPELKETVSNGENRYLKFSGTFGYEESRMAPKGSYFVSNGTMYHLTADTKLYGFRGYIEETDANGNPLAAVEARPFSLRIVDNYGGTTDIEAVGVETPEVSKPKGVYNLNGQCVRPDSSSLEGLPKGIYVVEGRKVIVR